MSSFILENVGVTLDDRVLVRAASAVFDPGVHAVVGRSGAGKSVLMKAACGLLPMCTGGVRLHSEDGLTIHAGRHDPSAFAPLRQRVAFVHQDPALLDELSVEDNLAFVLTRRRHVKGKALAAAVDSALVQQHLLDFRAAYPADLSPGLMRRVALTRAMLLRPDVLIVDEPTTGLDPRAARELDAALLALVRKGSTLIVITHDTRSLAQLQPRIHFVHERTVVWEGPFVDSQSDLAPPPLRALLAGQTMKPVSRSVEEVEEMGGWAP